MPELWAGIDAGKANHHCVLIDDEGNRLLSRKVANDEAALTELLTDVLAIAAGRELLWATDLNRGGAALLIALLEAHNQTLIYIPGRTVYHAARTYRGDGKTDAKDAAIIADQARMRRDLQPIRSGDQISTDLRLLTSRRTDLVCGRTRALNRLCATLLEYFPALEAAFDYAMVKAAVVLLTKYTTPAGIRRAGEARITTWLRNQGCYNAKATGNLPRVQDNRPRPTRRRAASFSSGRQGQRGTVARTHRWPSRSHDGHPCVPMKLFSLRRVPHPPAGLRLDTDLGLPRRRASDSPRGQPR